MFDLTPFDRRQRSLSNYFDNFEKTFFGDILGSMGAFNTDILDQGDKYVLQAELPGFAKEDIHIDLNGDMLTIHAEHKEENEEKDNKCNFVRRERRYGSFSRSFDVAGIKTNEITAEYKNGVLEMNLPKATSKAPATRQIELR